MHKTGYWVQMLVATLAIAKDCFLLCRDYLSMDFPSDGITYVRQRHRPDESCRPYQTVLLFPESQ